MGAGPQSESGIPQRADGLVLRCLLPMGERYEYSGQRCQQHETGGLGNGRQIRLDIDAFQETIGSGDVHLESVRAHLEKGATGSNRKRGQRTPIAVTESRDLVPVQEQNSRIIERPCPRYVRRGEVAGVESEGGRIVAKAIVTAVGWIVRDPGRGRTVRHPAAIPVRIARRNNAGRGCCTKVVTVLFGDVPSGYASGQIVGKDRNGERQ